MVFDVAGEDVRDIADAALFVRIILTRTCLPAVAIINVGFPRWVPETQEPPRDDRDGILEVGDADKRIQFAVDEIGKRLVSDL